MTNNISEIGYFGLGITLLQYEGGRIEPQLQIGNENVPDEIVIMILKSFLKKLEKEYLNSDN